MASTYDEYVPELGVIVSFPVGVSEEAKQRFIQRKLSGGAPAPTPPPPTSSTMDDVLRNVGGFALGVPRGIIEGIAAVPEGIGGITGSELLKSTGAAIRDNPLSNLFAGEASTGRMAGELIGNLATFLAPGSIAKLAGAPRLATGLSAIIGGASGAAEQVREAEQNRLAGMQVTPEQEQTAAIMGVAPGLAETLIPFGRLTRNLAPGLAGAAQIAGEGLGARAARIGQSAVIGGLTEGAQRGLQNVIEQQVYNPQQDALEGIVQEAGIGAVAEGGLEGLIGFLTKRVAVKGLQAKQQRLREGASATVEAGTQDATAVETDAEGFPVYRHVGKRRINPYAPFAGSSTSEAVGIAPVEPVGDVAGAGEAVLPTDVTIPGLTGLYTPSPESSTLRVQTPPARTTNPYAPFPGGSTFERLAQQMNERARVLSQPGADIVSAPPATGPIPAPPEVPFFPMGSTYGMAGMPSPMLPTVDEFGNIVPAGEVAPPPGATIPSGGPRVQETAPTLPDYMRGLSPEDLALAEDIQAMSPVEAPVARRDIQAEQRRGAAILEEILNPRPPYVEPITPNYPMPTLPVSLTSEGTFRQPSNLYTDLPRTMRGTGIPVAPPTIQRQAAAPPVAAETSLFPGVSPERDASLRQMFEQKRRQELADEARTLLDRLEVIDQQIETAITPRPDIAQERRTLGAELQDLFSRLTEIDQQIESRISPAPAPPAVSPALAPEVPPAFTRDPMIDQLLAEQRRQAEAPSAFPQTTTSQRDASLRQMFRQRQVEEDRPFMRAQAEQVRAARRTARPTVPETGVPDERVLDAQQRLAREEFNKNLAELNPDELAIVQAKQESGLGTAVRPQEIAEVQEFADLPFTRDQYRQAIEIGKTTAPMGTRGVASASTIARSLNVPVETAQSITDTMVRRGDATPIPRSPGTIRINPAATGPRFSVETQATPEPAPAPEPITVEAFRQRIARGEIPEVPSQIHSELKALGVDDLLSARLVDSLGNPQVAGQYANRIVSLALAGRSPDQLRSTLNHEVVHALKELKIFSTAEWNLLQNTLSPSAVLSEDEQKFYSDLYRNDPEALAEEAVARGMQKFIDGRMDLPRPAASAVEKTTSVFSKLGDLFRQRGLETPEQVIGAFRAGEIGRRQLPGETSTAARQPTVATRQPNTADTTNVRDLETLLGRTDSEGYVIPEERDQAGAPTPRLSIEQEPVPNPLFAQPDPQKSIGQRAAETLQVRPTLPSEIRTQVIDRRAPIAQLARAAGTIGNAEVSSEEAVRRLDQANDQGIANLKFGAMEFVGKPGNGYFIASEGAHPLGSDGYMVRMAEIGKLDKFFHYLAGLRSTALGEREKQLTPAQIRQFLSYGNDPRIKQAAAEHKQFNDGMIDAVVASGRFSKEEGERLKRDMYIPYLRISQTPEGDIRFTAGGSNLASSPKLKALKGGLGQARDPLATYVENVQMLTTMALKNEAMNRISRDGIQTGYIRPARKGDENTVPVWVNGQKKRMAILDQELYESVTYAPQPLSGMVKILALPARFLRSSVVFNPIYPIRNLIRDSQQVFAQGYTDMPLVSALDGVRKALTRSESYRDLERFGVVSSNIRGEGGGEGTAREARATFDDSLLGAVSKGIRAFEDFNQRFEAANRVVVYENLLKRGRTKAQAAMEARELINFNRHGANVHMRTLSALIPFQNARIQGADVLYRAALTKDNPEMRRQLYTRSAMLAALSMVYAATVQSNPAYQSASDEERENNWFVPLPDGEAIRVPIPFELGWFVKVVPENLARMMNGTADGKVFLESLSRFIDSTMKLEVTPQAIKPFQEAMITNFDDFRQKKVEPDYMKRLELADRYDERTTLVAKKISEFSNGQISPIQADHMLRGYSGTSMNYVWQMVEFLSNPQASPSLSGRQAAEMPVVGTLFARKDGGRKLGEAYEVRDLADQAAASLRLRLREGTPIEAPERERLNREMGFDQAIEPINQALTALNQRERALRRDIRMGRVTGTQAKPELDDIRRRKLDLSERVLEIRKRMVPGG